MVVEHANKRCRVAKVDDNGGAGANVSYQLLREPPIVLYLVHTWNLVLLKLELALSTSLCGAPAFQIRAVRWNASQASTAMVAPRAVEQR